MKGIADYAVVYDITCDRERWRIDRLLKGFGFRVQKGVFECRLNRRGKEGLINRLGQLESQAGFVKVYRLEHCAGIEVIGAAPVGGTDDGNVFFV